MIQKAPSHYTTHPPTIFNEPRKLFYFFLKNPPTPSVEDKPNNTRSFLLKKPPRFDKMDFLLSVIESNISQLLQNKCHRGPQIDSYKTYSSLGNEEGMDQFGKHLITRSASEIQKYTKTETCTMIKEICLILSSI